MRATAATLALPLFFALAASAPARAETPSIRVVEHGIYAVRETGEVVAAPRTPSGSIRPADGTRLLEETDRIFAQLGQSFGARIDLQGFPPGPVTLTIRTLHPPLTNPETGRTLSVSEFDWQVSGRRRLYFGFGFDHRWEIAEGLWTLQFIHDGRVLAEQRFSVHVPLN